MALRTIVQKSDDVIRKTSRPVEKFDEKLHILLDDMKETLFNRGGFGLAAVQVGVLKRVLIISYDPKTEEMSDEVLEVINPVIISQSKDMVEDYEGCLSCGDVRGLVKRPKALEVEFSDRYGNKRKMKVKGWLARIFCHEMDHLDGRIFLDIATEIQ